MRILVTGAAGYIGSVVTEQLVERGHEVVAVDDLRHGHRAAVHPDAYFVPCDLVTPDWLKYFLRAERVDAVIHLAAEALIDESLRDPGRFFQANVCGGLNLLEAIVGAGITRIIYSSTAAVYGEPAHIPIKEEDLFAPVNSYGESKLAFERMMGWYERSYGLKHVSLRYFNACGATERYGEFHVPETHLIPLLLEVALGQRDALHLYGTDYGTADGTCIRDYIHVSDIAHAHLLALECIDELGAQAYNMGNGNGYSNYEVIQTVQSVTGSNIPVVPSARRPGDPARLVASSDKIRRELGWSPRFPELEAMVETAWQWRQKHPRGYDS